MKKGDKIKEETKIKMSLAQLGRPKSIEHRKNISESKKGVNNPMFGKPLSDLHRKKIGDANRGEKHWTFKRKFSEEHKKRLSEAHRGKKLTLEHRRKMSESQKGIKHHRWKGGITGQQILIRHSGQYLSWRKSVYERDDYTCQRCKKRGGSLLSHHKYNFSEFPDLRFDLDNGITLCKECHRDFHKTYGYRKNNPNQLNEFICQKTS